MAQDRGGPDIHLKGVKGITGDLGQDLGRHCPDCDLHLVGSHGLRRLDGAVIDGLDGLIDQLGDHAEGKYRDGQDTCGLTDTDNCHQEGCQEQIGDRPDDIQEKADDPGHHGIPGHRGGGQKGKGHCKEHADHGAHHRHLEGLYHGIQDIRDVAEVRMGQPSHEDSDLVRILEDLGKIRLRKGCASEHADQKEKDHKQMLIPVIVDGILKFHLLPLPFLPECSGRRSW